MKDHPWEKAWNENQFSITTHKPSLIIKKHENLLKEGGLILDAGCGTGRNTIYLAKKGIKVDCFDVRDAEWLDKLPIPLQENINFTKTDILSFDYQKDAYDAVVANRVLQYLNKEEILFFLSKTENSLKRDGIFLMSFNNMGGIFKKEKIDVPKYKYTIEDIELVLQNFFKEVSIFAGSKKSKHVNYSDNIRSYDIFAAGLVKNNKSL